VERGICVFRWIKETNSSGKPAFGMASVQAWLLGLGGGVPHFLLYSPLAGNVFVQYEEKLAVTFHHRLVRWLEALRFQAPFRGPVAGNLNVAEIYFFADDFVAGHLRADVVDEFAYRGASIEGRHAGQQAHTVFGPHGDNGGVVHAEMGIDELFVES